VSRVGRRPPEYRWLLPAVLREEAGGVRGPRSARDWVVDTVCFLLGLMSTLSFTLELVIDLLSASPPDFGGRGWMWADLAIGLALSTALWWRRRWPLELAVATLLASCFSASASGISFITLFTVAVHRRFGVAVAVAVATLLPGEVYGALHPVPDDLGWWPATLSIVVVLVVTLWGMVVRSRRQLVVSLRDRAERADAEQQLRVAQARAMERTRIAREMHDVLAHRISLLSLHAGALEIHPDASPAQVATAAGVIRASAHQALQDLREVIGVLRAADEDDASERPQPTLSDLPALADECRAARVDVDLDLRADTSQVPTATGRAAYRIVQEGLTNARKHAPGATVRVRVTGTPATGLDVELRNPAPPPGAQPVDAVPGTGTGLVGLTERATLAGGRLSAGPDAGGGFTLRAWLPWPPGETTP